MAKLSSSVRLTQPSTQYMRVWSKQNPNQQGFGVIENRIPWSI